MKAKPLILLAPSEDKAPGGAPGRLRETPAQRWVREALVDLAQTASPAALQKALQVKGLALDRARAEALALGVRVPPAAWGQVHILSSLRGLVRGDELVPPYKLKLSALPGLKAHWRRALPAQLDALPEGPLWELLPGDAADLLKGWTRPRHSVEIYEAEGRAMGHFSKKFRGLVARWLLSSGQGDPHQVLRGRIPGCSWVGVVDNDQGGLTLKLLVDP